MPKVKSKKSTRSQEQKQTICPEQSSSESLVQIEQLKSLYKILSEVEENLQEILKEHKEITSAHHRIQDCMAHLTEKFNKQERDQQAIAQEMQRRN